MAKGLPAKEGSTYVSANGYHYTKHGGKYRLTHHIIAERNLGRPLRQTEQARFKDGDRTNLSPDNIVVVEKNAKSVRTRLARVEAQIRELQAQKELLLQELQAQEA